MCDDNKRGLYQKYIVTKTDGRPVDPNARYFVLRYDDDLAAQIALLAYAWAVFGRNRSLYVDLCAELVKQTSPYLTSECASEIGGAVAKLQALTSTFPEEVQP